MLATEDLVRLSELEQTSLLDAAYHTIATGLHCKQVYQPRLEAHPNSLRRIQSSFVKLWHGDALRGCAGTVIPTVPLICDVCHNAFGAAFPTFDAPRIRPEELDELSIHLTVIGKLQPLQAHSLEAAMELIEPGTHGLFIQQGNHRDAIFLPDVWERFPSPISFFQQLKLKAGCPVDAWYPDVALAMFTTQVSVREARSAEVDFK